MKKAKRFIIVAFLLATAVIMDTTLYLLKKIRGTLYFPGG